LAFIAGVIAVLGLTIPSASAGTISYVKITGDADCGISDDNIYTHTLDFGTGTPGASINGVQFDAYNAAANGTLNFNRTAVSGTLNDHAGNANHNVTGGLVDLLTDMYYNGNNAVNGTTTWTLSGLTAGQTYHTRIYTRQWGANNDRLAIFVFDPDGAGPISDSTEKINQDNATSVGFPNDNDAYYINYEFTAVAGEDLVITLTQDLLNQSWHLYGLTNQEYSPAIALLPDPKDGATDVFREPTLSWTPGAYATTHDVYFGTSLDDVAAATTDDPLDVLVSPGQTANTFDPGRLELGTTYYWRIDEVNDAPDFTVYPGKVWQFTVEPKGYGIENLSVTSTGIPMGGSGPEKTIDGSGLDDQDRHSVEIGDMWMAMPAGDTPLQLEYEFDKAYPLHEMWVWNYNMALESVVNFGVKDVTVEYSLDGIEWTLLGEEEFNQAPGQDTYVANTAVSFNGAMAQYVRLTINSSWGGTQFGLSEVRFLYLPLWARNPDPASGAANMDPTTSLFWRPGRQADRHEVYVDTDEQAVIDGTVSPVTVSESSYEAELDLGRTYYWKVNEVNDAEDPAVWEGDVWNFSTVEYLVVDDFESYTNDSPNRVFQTWVDGAGFSADPYFPDGVAGNNSGALVGHDIWTPGSEHYEGEIVEVVKVRDGGKAMPLYYDNTSSPFYSEAERSWAEPQNWARHSARSLSVSFFGDRDNSGEPYLKVNGISVPYEGSPDDLKIGTWLPWTVNLDDLVAAGVDVQNVTTLAVGVEGSNANGMLLFDAMRLYPYAADFITPADPGSEGLVAYYPLDGDGSDAAGNHDGTVTGNPPFADGVQGQALNVTADGQYVTIPYADDFALNTFTVSVWVNAAASESPLGILGTRFNSDNTFDVKVMASTIHGDIGDGAAWLSTAIDIPEAHGGDIRRSTWYHIVYVLDDATDTAYLYLDGALATTVTFSGTPLFMKPDQELRIGMDYPTEPMRGAIDEVRIYNRVLSPAEVAHLAGRTERFYQSF
jgi:hypothetical protein